jgi:hypothetical protein
VILIQLYKKKEAQGMGKSFLANIPPPTCKKSGLELCLAQDAGPLGNLAARQGQASWPASKLPVWQRGKRYLKEGILRENLEAAGTPVKEVVSGKLPDFLIFLLQRLTILNLTYFNKETIPEVLFQFNIYGSDRYYLVFKP